MKIFVGKPTERGFTLIEMLVILSIVGFVAGAISMSIITVMRVSPQSTNRTVALSQVQNAGFWICRDVEMSRSLDVDPDPATPLFLTLFRPEWDDSVGDTDTKTITYALEDMSGTSKRLVRTHEDTGQTMISEYIYYDPVDDPDSSTRVIEYDDVKGILTLRMVSTYGDATVSREYSASHRVSAE